MTDVDEGRLSTGIDGLDEVLRGGYVPERSYMIHGPAGAGKTIMALHFLEAAGRDGRDGHGEPADAADAADAGETAETGGDGDGDGDGDDREESTLFVNLEEDVADLRSNAAAVGFDVSAIDFLDLSPGAEVFAQDQSYDVFEPAEVEQAPVAEAIVDRVDAIDPDRVVVDPLTQLHYLTSGDYQFRKQVTGLIRFLQDREATVVFTAQASGTTPTEDLQYVCDGTIRLVHEGDRRLVRVPKFRGSGTLPGDHAFRIGGDGVSVYPALDPSQYRDAVDVEMGTVSSGVPEVDALLNGGIERGTVTILSGPTGVGKTTLGTQFAKEAAGRGERTVVYLFEESERTFLHRSEAVNIPVRAMIDRGTLVVEEVDALDVSPQEFAARVRTEVQADADIVMIDGIAGYRLTLGQESDRVTRHLHALGHYLKSAGVTTILVDETPDVTGPFHATRENLSYLADTIVFLRHLELDGELRKAIGVLKKRTSDYERTLREFQITEHGITVGDRLTDLRGILSGTPEVVDRSTRGDRHRDDDHN